MVEREASQGFEVSIPEDIARYRDLGLLDALLSDRTTGGNILWATSAYEHLGEGYTPVDPLTRELISGQGARIIRRRAQKAKNEKTALTRQHAEVFTPSWVCRLMIDHAENAWAQDVGFGGASNGWKRMVAATRLEITCGEAPFIANRYDAETGEPVALVERIGILDRKLALVSANIKTRKAWLKWMRIALESVYGYELQGDNLLIARINVLRTVEDFAGAAGFGPLSREELAVLCEVVAWNFWQMDGLTKCVPFGTSRKDREQKSLFDLMEGGAEEEVFGDCRIYDWKRDEPVEFAGIRKGSPMKFDYIIGNPPYQEDKKREGDRANPLYDKFMSGAYVLSDTVELITPARFLFDAGQTSKAWNRSMLDDEHLKVIAFWPSSQSVFPPPTDIKGGIAVTMRTANRIVGPIGSFEPNEYLAGILHKLEIVCSGPSQSFADIVSSQGVYQLTETFFTNHPYVYEKECIGRGTGKKLVSKTMEKMPEIFKVAPSEVGAPCVALIGKIGSKRERRYIDSRYIQANEWLDAYNVLLPEANGTGKFGEVLSAPTIGGPGTGHTDTFLSIGAFDSESEALACECYIKSKFVRALLGTKTI